MDGKLGPADSSGRKKTVARGNIILPGKRSIPKNERRWGCSIRFLIDPDRASRWPFNWIPPTTRRQSSLSRARPRRKELDGLTIIRPRLIDFNFNLVLRDGVNTPRPVLLSAFLLAPSIARRCSSLSLSLSLSLSRRRVPRSLRGGIFRARA